MKSIDTYKIYWSRGSWRRSFHFSQPGVWHFGICCGSECIYAAHILHYTTHQMKFSISPQEFRQEYLSNPYHKHKILEMKIFVLMHYSSFVSRIYWRGVFVDSSWWSWASPSSSAECRDGPWWSSGPAPGSWSPSPWTQTCQQYLTRQIHIHTHPHQGIRYKINSQRKAVLHT